MGWWEKESLRMVEVVDAMDFNAIPLEKVAEAVKKLGGNFQHFHCMLHAADANDTSGLNDRRFFFETVLAKKKNPDRLKAYLPLAHKKKIRVVVYFNVHWYSREFGKEHPDWLQIKEDGKPFDEVYNTGVSFCVNSPWREWVFQILRDLCKYGIDGIFYDGPIFFDSSCYCAECRKLFQQETGEEIPLKSNRRHPLWKKLIKFQADSIARFLADSNSVIKKINPEILFYMNGNSNWPYWPTGRDNHKIVCHQDMLIAEGGFFNGDLNQPWLPIYKPGVCAKLLSSQSHGKPVFSANCAGHKPWSWYLLPKTEIGLMMAETLAGGAGLASFVFPGDLSQPELEAISSYNKFVKDNPAPFFQTESLARVALLWPSDSVEVYTGSTIPLTDFTKEIKAEGVGDIGCEFNGFYEGLARAQVPFDVIDEENLGEVSRYELLFLPNAACLSRATVEALEKFVANGGNLVASFETSLYDEAGQKKPDFQLGKLFGVEFSGTIFGPMGWDYISTERKSGSPLLAGITKKYLPAPAYGIKVEPTTGRIPLYFCGKLAGRYEHTPEISSQPFMSINRFGKGSAVYLAGTFGACLVGFRFSEYLMLLQNICRRFSTNLVAVKDAPWVEVSLRQKKGEVFLHLINQTSGLKRPLTSIRTLMDLSVTLSGLYFKQAHALRLNKKVRIEKTRGETTLLLPRLDDYEVIALK